MVIKGLESKEFFLNGKMFLIAPLRGENNLTDQTIKEVQNKPGFYAYGHKNNNLTIKLAQLCKDNDPDSEVFKVTYEGTESIVVAIGFYRLNDETGDHEMGMVVQKKYRGTRIAHELFDSLRVEAKKSGVKSLYTTDSENNVFMHNLAHEFKMTERDRIGRSGDIVYSLKISEQAPVVKVTGV